MYLITTFCFFRRPPSLQRVEGNSFTPLLINSPGVYEVTGTLTTSGKSKAGNTVSTLQGLMVEREVQRQSGVRRPECNLDFWSHLASLGPIPAYRSLCWKAYPMGRQRGLAPLTPTGFADRPFIKHLCCFPKALSSCSCCISALTLSQPQRRILAFSLLPT